MDAADDGGEKSFRIRSAFDDGSGDCTTEKRRDFIGNTGGFAKDLPDGGKLGIGLAFADGFGELTDDFQASLMIMKFID